MIIILIAEFCDIEYATILYNVLHTDVVNVLA